MGEQERKPGEVGPRELLMAAAIVVAGIGGVCAYKMSNDGVFSASARARNKERAAEARAAAAPALSPLEQIGQQLDEAFGIEARIAIVRPLMADAYDQPSDGAIALSYWAAKGMLWSHVEIGGETTVERVMKDADAERGKRMCYQGQIIEIAKVPVGPDRHVFRGLLQTRRRGNLIHFYAAGNTGDLVQRSRARFCGIVIGRFDYTNSIGGTGHAVDVVGMFDPSTLR